MSLEFRTFKRLILAACLSLAAATAGAATVEFDFDLPGVSCSSSPCYEPTFVDEGGFQLTHTPGTTPGDIGRPVQYYGSSEGVYGEMWLGATASEAGDVTSATMHFSEDVTSIDMTYYYFEYCDSECAPPQGVDLIPILSNGTDAPPEFWVHVGESEGQQPAPTITGGPYSGLRIETRYPQTFSWDDLVLETVESEAQDPAHPRGIILTESSGATDVQIIDTPGFKSRANKVVRAGEVNADFCVARDLRELKKPNGTFVYTARAFKLKEATGGDPASPPADYITKGTCTGPIPPTTVKVGSSNVNVTTWEQLLSYVNLELPPWSRSLKGTFQGKSHYWIVIGIVRSTAEFEGVIGALPSPETLITYQQFPDAANNPNDQLQPNGELKCNSSNVALRPLTFSGAVTTFGDFANVEGNRMIPDIGQCDGQLTLTRRTTHAYPQRIDAALLPEALNIETQIAGLAATLTQAYNCVNTAQRASITQMRAQLVTAQLNLLLRRYGPAVVNFEELARIADRPSTSFSSCGAENLATPGPRANYKGAFIARALAASFTVWDRFIYRSSPWVQYIIPTAGSPALAPDVPYSNQPKAP